MVETWYIFPLEHPPKEGAIVRLTELKGDEVVACAGSVYGKTDIANNKNCIASVETIQGFNLDKWLADQGYKRFIDENTDELL